MRIKTNSICDAGGPNESLVTIDTTGQPTEVIVHNDSVRDGYLDVAVVMRQQSMALVELPRETTRGFWRIWVPAAMLSD